LRGIDGRLAPIPVALGQGVGSHGKDFAPVIAFKGKRREDLMESSSLAIRVVYTVEDLMQVLNLECQVWGTDEPVPVSLLKVFAEDGGLVLLAELAGERKPVGMAVSFPGRRLDRWYLHSHMLAVLPQFRRHAVGRALKYYQLSYARDHQLAYVGWTFDPLQAKNAQFNLNVLGARATAFYDNFYGVLGDAINGAFPSHRLFVEWDGQTLTSGSGRYLAMPKDIDSLRRTHPDEALWWTKRYRQKLERLIAQGYIAVGVVVKRDRTFYRLQRV
jgi:predicted GNAT superfamily acetyltransferase